MKYFFILLLSWAYVNAYSQDLGERLKGHVSFLADTLLEGRGLGTSGKILAEQYIEDNFKKAGIQPWKGDYRHNFSFRTGLIWVNATNFVGVIPGNDPLLKDEYIIIGAHYDHLGYTIDSDIKTYFTGADDNASGVASIIELGGMLNAQQSKLKRSVIIVAFDAEESGLLGAKNFVEEEIVPLKAIKTMFSLDMVGMYSDHKGLDLKGIESLAKGDELSHAIALQKNIVLKQKSAAIEQRTDTAPFGQRGIPAVHVFTGLKSPYHKPEDKAHLLDYEGMAKINEFMVDLVVSISQEPVLESNLAFVDSSTSKKIRTKFDFGFIAGIGQSNHMYLDEFYDAKSALSFKGGVFSEVHLSRLLSLQTHVQYDINRSKIQDGVFNRHSLNVPLNLTLSTPTKNTEFRAYVAVGPYYRHNFSAKMDNRIYDIPEQVLDNEWGYNWEFGFIYNKLRFGWNYQQALTNVFNSTENLGRVRSRGSSFFVGLGI